MLHEYQIIPETVTENNIYRHAWERKEKICYKIYM